MSLKTERRQRIKMRIRKKVSGSVERPRMSVFRSNKQIYVQLVDDLKGHTIVSASSREEGISAAGVCKIDQAKKVGDLAAKKALAAGVKKVVFDRGGYLYHGRVKAVAEGAREGGLDF